MGVIQSLEGLRSMQIGTAMMAAFIESELTQQPQFIPIIDRIQNMADIGRELVEALPPFMEWCKAAWLDYLDGVD